MKSIVSAVALCAVLAGCNFTSAKARDAGPTVDRNYTLGAFDRIVVAGPYEVVVTTGGQPGAKAHGGEAILNESDIRVENGVLVIGPRKKNGINGNWSWGKDGKVVVTVSAAAIHGATIAGSGGMRIDHVTGGKFKAEVAGSGDLDIARMEVEAVELAVAGSGNIVAAGTAQSIEVSIAGSGDVDLAKLVSATAEVSIVGSGNVRANATETADVTTMGSGDVALTGGAQCSISKHGSGDVTCS